MCTVQGISSVVDRPDPDPNPDPVMYLELTQRECQIVNTRSTRYKNALKKMKEQSGSTVLLTGLEAVKLESMQKPAYIQYLSHMLMHFFKQSSTVREGACFQIKGTQA